MDIHYDVDSGYWILWYKWKEISFVSREEAIEWLAAQLENAEQ